MSIQDITYFTLFVALGYALKFLVTDIAMKKNSNHLNK